MSPRKKEEFREITEASKEKILNAAFNLFASLGYARTSMDMVAKKAKISKGLIYHYFKSKEEILRTIFIQFLEKTDKQIWTKNDSPESALENFIESFVHYTTQEIQFNRLMISLAVQPDVVKGLKNDMERLREGWWGKISNILKESGFKDPEAEAYLLGAILDGFGLGCIVMGKEYPTEKVKKLIKKKYGL